MKILIVGNGKEIADVVVQAQKAEYFVKHVPEPRLAVQSLIRMAYDLVLITECEKLEETDLIAESFKGFCLRYPCVVVLWDAACGFENAREYGLESIDFLLEKFSVDMCEKILQFANES